MATKMINVSWTRFILACLFISIFPGLLLFAAWDDDDMRPATVAMVLGFLSILVFLARGWARLREANKVAPIPVADRERIRSLVRGPRTARLIWLSMTILLVALSAIVLGLMGAKTG